MNQQSDDHVIPYPKSRHFMEEAIRSTHHKPMMHGLLEVDVTKARAYLREVKARTGESPSFTAFIIACLGRAVDELISQDIKAIARRTLGEIFPRGDVAALAEVVHPNFVDHDGPPGAPPGLDSMIWSMRLLQAAFSDRRWQIHQVIAEDDTVVLSCTFHGRHTGEFMGLTPTSRSFAFRQVHIVRFQDGRGIETGPSPTTSTWRASFWGDHEQ